MDLPWNHIVDIVQLPSWILNPIEYPIRWGGATRQTGLQQATWFSDSLHISFKPCPFLYIAQHRDFFQSTLPCKNPATLPRVPFALNTCLNHLGFLILTISSSVSHFSMCSVTLLCVSTLGVCVWSNAPATVFCSNCSQVPVCVSPDLS